VGVEAEGFLVPGDDPRSAPPLVLAVPVFGEGSELGRPGRPFALHAAGEVVAAGVHGRGGLRGRRF
jgi:hypothetical protein